MIEKLKSDASYYVYNSKGNRKLKNIINEINVLVKRLTNK